MVDLDDVIQKMLEFQEEFDLELNPPATTAEITQFEEAFALTLPAELVEFYRFSNGFETSDFIFRIIPLKEIVQQFGKSCRSGGVFEFTFAEYMIYSDTWEIVITQGAEKEYEIIYFQASTKEITVLSNSLFEFIIRYFECDGVHGDDGLYDWIEQRKSLGY